MEDLRTDFIDRINAAHDRWRRLVADVGEERMELPGAMGDWTFKDVASHLTAWRRRTIGRLEAAGRGELEPPSPWPVELREDEDDPINAWIHDQTKDHSLSDVLADADLAYDDLVAAIQALRLGDDTTGLRRLGWLGPNALVDFDPAGHLIEHETDVRRWLESLPG
jgi:hypothetical protein